MVKLRWVHIFTITSNSSLIITIIKHFNSDLDLPLEVLEDMYWKNANKFSPKIVKSFLICHKLVPVEN